MKSLNKFFSFFNMKNKKALQLSINFIVILIMAIVIFGFGITFVGKFFAGAAQLKADLDMDTQKRIQSLLDTGEQIAIPVNTKTLEVGQSSTFGMGILNILGEEKYFTIEISCTTALDSKGQPIDASQYCEKPKEKEWVFQDNFQEQVKNNEQKVVSLLFQVPKGTVAGKYIFTIKVLYDANKVYDVPRKIYINVK